MSTMYDIIIVHVISGDAQRYRCRKHKLTLRSAGCMLCTWAAGISDVGIAEQQKVGKQGRNDSIKQFGIQQPLFPTFC